MAKIKVGDIIKVKRDLNSVRHGVIPEGFIEEIESVEYSSGVEGYILAGLPDFWVYEQDITLIKSVDRDKGVSKARDNLLEDIFGDK